MELGTEEENISVEKKVGKIREKIEKRGTTGLERREKRNRDLSPHSSHKRMFRERVHSLLPFVFVVFFSSGLGKLFRFSSKTIFFCANFLVKFLLFFS